MTAPAQLFEAAAPLYRGAIADFTAARGRAVQAAKQAGDAALAQAIKGLPKPGATAWAVGQVHWREPERIDALFESAAHLRSAVVAGAEPALQQRAGAAHRQRVNAALEVAIAAMQAAGHGVSVAVRRRVTTTLEALAALGRWPAPGPGCLAEDLDPPGFDAWGAMPVGPSMTAPDEAVAAAAANIELDLDARVREATSARDDAAAAALACAHARDRAIDEARDALASRDAARVRVARAQAELEQAETTFTQRSQVQQDRERELAAATTRLATLEAALARLRDR
ncbi:MAG: hypothetical protein IPH07_10355 [Deltaproteobacteria bacterium]|nr:hypothetical protein [Deltaproteobacteria bacterium]MBK8237137.1 hypothetical protein [Deltaproteobacteria bacterium]MBK8718830.1 hypothetical protein [Deltaproteobacteria bacterium]MBP7286548.1 hypothetical protein [Nannocystaceae bacterium]